MSFPMLHMVKARQSLPPSVPSALEVQNSKELCRPPDRAAACGAGAGAGACTEGFRRGGDGEAGESGASAVGDSEEHIGWKWMTWKKTDKQTNKQTNKQWS